MGHRRISHRVFNPMILARTLRAGAMAAAFALAGASLTGCATVPPGGTTADVSDPLEGLNRAVYGFNEGADILFIRPAAEIYRGTVPDPIRTAVRNFLRNLASPLIIAHQLFQGDLEGAKNATARMLVNTTIGLGGTIDIAADAGLPYQSEDLGQTLAVWGVPDGPYLVLPLIGPSTARDSVGLVGDALADPVNNWAVNTGNGAIPTVRSGVSSIDTRSQLIEPIDDLRRNSLDPYAALRSLYLQRRATEIRDGQTATEFPEFEETPAK